MGSGKRLNGIEKVQIKAFKNLNLSTSEISRKVNRLRKVIYFHFLKSLLKSPISQLFVNKRNVLIGFTRSNNIGTETSTKETKDVILTYRAYQPWKLLITQG